MNDFTYVHVDQDGAIEVRQATNYIAALDDVGPEGWNRVRLNLPYAGFVNDCGHVLPDRYRRNIVGSVLLMAFGAPTMPYAGPIVVTGWDDYAHPDDVEVRGLDEAHTSAVVDMGNAIREALDLPTPPRSGRLVSSLPDSPRWSRITREMVVIVETAPTPGMSFITDPAEMLRHLRGAP